uniref:C-type lectin domain-containing protein n=1 Tax=Ascaris lumbricoides TaxID=6252 RepID=A0A0M3IDT1_ASCLU
MIVLVIVALSLLISSARGCATDAECGVFDRCDAATQTCVANTAGCTQACAANQVCVPPNCVAAPTPAYTSATTCPSGWTLFNNNCYYVATGQFLFNQASLLCTQLSAKVVWFNQATPTVFRNEMNFVNSLTAARNVRYYWIGLNRMFGRWVWTDGTPALYTNWRPGEPDGCCGANTTCALVNYGNTLGQWDDAGCETLWANPQGFVCKKAV